MLNSANTFTCQEMTNAVNKLPLLPLRFAPMFETLGVRTREVALELRKNRICLVNDTSWDAEPEYLGGRSTKREVKLLRCTHLAQMDTLVPEDIQDVRSFGTTELVTPATIVNDRMTILKRNVDMTCEFHRLGAVKGIIVDADGKTELYNLFQVFGVKQKTETVPFPSTLPADGNPVLSAVLSAKRKTEHAMQGNPWQRIEAVVGSNFYDKLTGHELVREYFERWLARKTDFGDNDYRSRGFTYGGVTFYEASEVVGGQKLVEDNKGHMYPVGPGIWQQYHAPANWMETANTQGLPFYARMDERPRGRGYDIEVQSNPLTLCLYPEALVELTAGS